VKDYDELNKKIDNIILELNEQLSYPIDNKTFHSTIIKITADYPEQKDLLEFIVHINDKLETKHSIFTDIVLDSLNDILIIKKDMLLKLGEVDDKTKENEIKEVEGFFKKITNKILSISIKDFKIISAIIAFIILGIVAIIAPDMVMSIIEIMKGVK